MQTDHKSNDLQGIQDRLFIARHTVDELAALEPQQLERFKVGAKSFSDKQITLQRTFSEVGIRYGYNIIAYFYTLGSCCLVNPVGGLRCNRKTSIVYCWNDCQT